MEHMVDIYSLSIQTVLTETKTMLSSHSNQFCFQSDSFFLQTWEYRKLCTQIVYISPYQLTSDFVFVRLVLERFSFRNLVPREGQTTLVNGETEDISLLKSLNFLFPVFYVLQGHWLIAMGKIYELINVHQSDVDTLLPEWCGCRIQHCNSTSSIWR